MSKIPEPWATRLIERGYTDRRSTRTARPSYGALADELGINTSTISEAVTGKRRPTVETILSLMEKLGSDVAEWLGVEQHGDWEPPTEVALLNIRQRRALEELIRSMTERSVGGDTAPNTIDLPKLREVKPHEVDIAASDPEGRGTKGMRKRKGPFPTD